MSKVYILSPDCYLYAFIDNYQGKSLENPKPELAIDKDIITYATNNPTILKTGDKLIVHGVEIHESRWAELCKSLYHFGWQCVCDNAANAWYRGLMASRIGINSEGDCISVITDYKVHKNTTFELPCKFDWPRYGVMVPNSTNDVLIKKKHEVEEKATQVRKLEKQVQELEAELTKLRLLREDCIKAKEDCTKTKEIEGRTQQLITKLEHKLEKKDEKIEKSQGKVKELKQQLNKLQLEVHERDKKLGKEEVRIEDLKQQVTGLGQQVTSMWQQLKSKDKWAQDHMRQLVDSGFISPTAPSLVRQKEFEKKLNQKIDQMVSLLHNIENMVKFKN